MKHIVKTVSLLSILAVIPGAMAATSRIGVSNKTSPRLPSIAGYLISGTTTSTATSTSSSTASYYDNSECIEKYTDCIKADDVCGGDFQECTTNVLFHGQMAKCLNVLYQCQSSGINALFGTTSIANLSEVQSTNGEDEITRYTYPLDGSVLGQLIIGAGITNKLTTEQCVKRYTNCLQRDDVCGADFELCTDKKPFKKQALLCDSTLQRCQSEGKNQLFGSVANANTLNPDNDSRLGIMIKEGGDKAALNAVKTCHKVVDTCIYNACVKNPWRCVEGINLSKIYLADVVGGGTMMENDVIYANDSQNDASTIRRMLKAQCLSTIGANKYCHMTYRLTSTVSDRDVMDVDNQEDVFSQAYSDRKAAILPRVQEALKKFDTNAKNSCLETIKSCAMRSCGGGLGSVCYKQAKSSSASCVNDNNGDTLVLGGSNALVLGSATVSAAPISAINKSLSFSTSTANNPVHVNGDATYNDIYAGCEAIVNADANCQYAAASDTDAGYEYAFTGDDASTFNLLFPRCNAGADKIGAVGTLNSILATSYNDAAIEKMKKQCQTVALSCVKSMCGKDYVNCYRNRTDIISGSYDTGAHKFDRSMNKMGGVLDYNIVQGLCMNTVKNSSVCEEHLKVATAEFRNTRDGNTWGDATSVRDAWKDANTTKLDDNSDMNSVIVACGPSMGDQVLATAVSAFTDHDMDCTGTMEPVNGSCDEVMDPDTGCIYNQPITVFQSEYVLENGAKTLFQQLLADVEKEAQAKYNAKLTKEQNVCLSNNNGGIMGSTDNGSTFMWVKLKGSKVPKTYQSKGLTAKQFIASNDLYGSFCRARVTVMSDDKDIQDMLTSEGGASVAYFAVGDSFTCGSWISNKTLEAISRKVGAREVCNQGYGRWENGECKDKKLSVKENIAYAWGTVAPALAGGAIGTALTESGTIAGLLNKSELKQSGSDTAKDKQKKCKSYASSASTASEEALCETYLQLAKGMCDDIGGTKCDITSSETNKLTKCRAEAKAVGIACENATVSDAKKDDQSAKAARIAVPIAATLGAGALGAGITASVIKQKKENIRNEAAQKWLDEIGEHIQCYLGTDELGTYGDVVSIELD